MLPVAGSIATSAACSDGLPVFAQSLLDRRLGGILQLGDEGRLHAPVGRMIAAEFIAEPLPQVRLGVAMTRIAVAAIGADAQRRLQRGAKLRLGDESLVAHAREHDVAARPRLVEVRPRRQRRRRARQAGDQRALRQRQRLSPACRTRAATSLRRRRCRRREKSDSGTARGSAAC